MIEFKDMNLKRELAESLSRAGFVNPTDVQEQVIPVALHGKDVIARAKTGTGKTCAFLIPIMEGLRGNSGVEAIVICPTRELALQIANVAEAIRPSSRIHIAMVYGGASINPQIEKIERGANIVVGTPGRIIDLMQRGVLDLESVSTVVLDEADTMLDMGFIEDIEFILSNASTNRQTMLFSATMPDKIVTVAKRYMRGPTMITVGDEEVITVEKIRHSYALVGPREKFAALLAYIHKHKPHKAIVFAHTQHWADILHGFLKDQGFDVMVLHGGLTQAKRERSLSEFKSRAQFLIATNVASRGIDIKGITDIINFDVPDDPYVYVHRVGRSARMGTEGKAFTIISYDQKNLIGDIEYVANIKMQKEEMDVSQYKDLKVDMHPSRGSGSFGHRGGEQGRGRGGFHSRGRPTHGGFRGDRGHGRGRFDRGRGRSGGGWRGSSR
ncbi:MAG: DEAD/DEAH box helicase [Candidatus Micrarchaeota archaeon]|nr:DEAD/DEAH box helicase [Candidatus Micrarchaeota archaeon]